MKHNNITVFFS